MTTPNAPVLGFTYPAPRTWSPGDFHTAARWRADMTNLGYLFAGKARPMLLSFNNDGQSLSSGSATLLFLGPNVPVNTWAVVVQNQSSPSNVTAYQIPFAGWYLLQGDVTLTTAGTPTSQKYNMGFQSVINGAGSVNTDGGSSPATTSTGVLVGMAGCELAQFNTFSATADTTAMYAFTSNSSAGSAHDAEFMIEWIGLPTSGLTNYSGPYGTVVASPQQAAAPPSGQGTVLVNNTPGGTSTFVVADPTGIVAGMTIGLEYLNGLPVPSTDPGNPGGPGPRSETLVVTGVSGANVSVFLGALFNHPAGSPVAVPLSAAFMNQQLRDIVNFLSYPPMLRAVTTGTQSIPSSTFPNGTQITSLSAATSADVDNFSGFASNAYTAQVAGVYLVYGQVYLAGSTSSFNSSAGLQVNSGTIQWGVRCASQSTSARTTCPTVRRHLRLNAGDTVKLYGTQDSGGSMNTAASGSAFSKLICVWRSV